MLHCFEASEASSENLSLQSTATGTLNSWYRHGNRQDWCELAGNLQASIAAGVASHHVHIRQRSASQCDHHHLGMGVPTLPPLPLQIWQPCVCVREKAALHQTRERERVRVGEWESHLTLLCPGRAWLVLGPGQTFLGQAATFHHEPMQHTPSHTVM